MRESGFEISYLIDQIISPIERTDDTNVQAELASPLSIVRCTSDKSN